jgi:predicted ArsR family transcriptional regulator
MGSLFDRLQHEIDAREQQTGLSPADLLDMPPTLAAVIKQIVRRNGMKLADIAETLGQPPAQTRQTLDKLVNKGLVRQVEVKDEVWYKAHFAHRRSRTLSQNLWSSLDDAVDSTEDK